MKFISNNNINDPSLNLAMEEYVLKNLPSEERTMAAIQNIILSVKRNLKKVLFK